MNLVTTFGEELLLDFYCDLNKKIAIIAIENVIYHMPWFDDRLLHQYRIALTETLEEA